MPHNYDLVPRFYDVDMARNMPFDDVGFYTKLCQGKAGRILELGCGTGRILLPLLACGCEVYGIDASDAMLRELQRAARRQALVARVCRMDLRALGFRPGFAAVLLAYSLVTYLVDDDELDLAFDGIRRVLAPGGLVVV